MINITKPIEIEIKHTIKKTYQIDNITNGISVTDENGIIKTYDSYAQVAYDLGLSRQTFYNIIKRTQNELSDD